MFRLTTTQTFSINLEKAPASCIINRNKKNIHLKPIKNISKKDQSLKILLQVLFFIIKKQQFKTTSISARIELFVKFSRINLSPLKFWITRWQGYGAIHRDLKSVNWKAGLFKLRWIRKKIYIEF